MKKTVLLLSLIIAFGCEKHVNTCPSDNDLVKVSLALSGEVTVEESPLDQTRAGDNESNDLIGIQVYEGTTPYAYGLFDSIDGKTIYLHSGKTYKFECAKIINGKNVVKKLKNGNYAGHHYSFYNGITEGYALPFIVRDPYYQEDYTKPLDTAFNYPNSVDVSKRYFFSALSEGEVALSSSSNRVYYPQIDRYYGELPGYKATSSGQVNIEMRHVVFGIKYKVTGITDGTVSISIKNSQTTFFQNSEINSDITSETKMFSFENVKSAWEYADDYTENVTVSMSWLRGVGVNQDLGSQSVQIKRNKVNIINIALSTSTRSSTEEKTDGRPEVKIQVTTE